jgi:hypothetical protein
MFAGAKGKALLTSLSEQKAKVFEVGGSVLSSSKEFAHNNGFSICVLGPRFAASCVFQPGEGIELEKKEARPYQGPSPEEAAKIREAIANAKSIEEVMLLEKQLNRGQIPDGQSQKAAPPSRAAAGDIEEVEMDEE